MRVVIAGGGGGVGASVAFNLLLGPSDCEIVLLDVRREMVLSHAIDLEQVLEQGVTGTVRAGGEEDLASADVLVVSAAAPLTVNDSRMVYLEANARILASVTDLLPQAWAGLLLVVTNPVDPLCTWVQRRGGLDRRRVLGYTLNDSLRLRTGIGKVLGIGAGRVEAWTIGEHGELAVPLMDRVLVDRAAIELTERQTAEVAAFTDGWYRRHVALDSGRSSTWTSGLGVARMVSALLGPADPLPWPVSVVLAGEYGIDAISLSVPASIGRGGAERIHEWQLTGGQEEALRAGAAFVADAAARLGEIIPAPVGGR